MREIGELVTILVDRLAGEVGVITRKQGNDYFVKTLSRKTYGYWYGEEELRTATDEDCRNRIVELLAKS